jgi:ATP-dependent DNA ligase
MVAKDPAAPYVGGRTLKWLKVKQRDYRVEERGVLQAVAVSRA